MQPRCFIRFQTVLFPFDNINLLIINIIHSISRYRGTFLGYNYYKLVEANTLELRLICEISNQLV